MSRAPSRSVIDLGELDEYEHCHIRDDETHVGFDFDVQQYAYDNEAQFEQNLITIDDDSEDDDTLNSQAGLKRASSVPFPQTIELESIILECGTVELGDVVELKDLLGLPPGKLPRGDFLLITSIKETCDTSEISVCGYKLRRTTHIAPTFNKHVNDLFLFIHTRTSDCRPPFVQGKVEIPIDDVLRKRKCVFTHLREKAKCMSDVNFLPGHITGPTEKFNWVFEKGTLICRYVYIIGLYGRTEKSYKGEARFLYKRECLEFSALKGSPGSHISRQNDAGTNCSSSAPSSSKKRKRDETVVEIPEHRADPQHRHPTKSARYTFNDFFCGAGGASEGARQAGFRINLGLDSEEVAMKSYAKNHPFAKHLCMNAHDFPTEAKRSIHSAHHCHISCPCKYWSVAHSVPGKNDEQNMMTIFTPGPILEKTKPETISLEQTPGLLIIKDHALYFRNLINQCLNAGYNLRWEIQDMAWFGLAQHRSRLIFLGAKIGIPIPPMPKPIYGPIGSGLKPYRTVHDALQEIQRRGPRGQHDPHHQPDIEHHFQQQRETYDPKKQLASTVTAGCAPVHHGGWRLNTVREISQLQGFHVDYMYEGTKTQIREQLGNAWGPISVRHYLLSCGATKEALEKNLIGAEDEIDDLHEYLESKGLKFPDGTPSSQESFRAQFRYISKLRKTVKSKTHLVVFPRQKKDESSTPEQNRRDALSFDFFETPPPPPSLNSRQVTTTPRPQIRHRVKTEEEKLQFQRELEEAFIADRVVFDLME